MEERPFVLLASSRSTGHTSALVEAAFPRGSAVVVDLSPLKIGHFSYENRFAEDDFIPLIQRGLAHPSWIIATPLYWYTMSAQAKTFLDRLSDLLEFRKDLGRRLRGKHLAVLCSGSDAAEPPHFGEPFQLTAGYFGIRYLGEHYAQMLEGVPLTAAQRDQALRFALDRVPRRISAG